MSNCLTKLLVERTDLSKETLNYANNKNAFIRKESDSSFGFKVAIEILQHDQHTVKAIYTSPLVLLVKLPVCGCYSAVCMLIRS